MSPSGPAASPALLSADPSSIDLARRAAPLVPVADLSARLSTATTARALYDVAQEIARLWGDEQIELSRAGVRLAHLLCAQTGVQLRDAGCPPWTPRAPAPRYNVVELSLASVA